MEGRPRVVFLEARKVHLKETAVFETLVAAMDQLYQLISPSRTELQAARQDGSSSRCLLGSGRAWRAGVASRLKRRDSS